MLSCLRSTLLYRSYPSAQFSKDAQLSKCFWRNLWRKANRDGGGVNLAPKVIPETSDHHHVIHTIIKCSTFTAGVCGILYAGAAIWNYENVQRVRTKGLQEWLKSNWNTLDGFEHKEGEFRKVLNKWWNELPEGRRIFWAICAANVMVFLCWRYPPFQTTMVKYFFSNPTARVICWPMLLSTFSHYSPFHLFVNMYVLHSFCDVTENSLGREQFVAFYLAGGIISSLGGNLFKLLSGVTGPSLGASGAIMALLAYFCTKYPDAQLGIIFLPNFPFSADLALKGIMLLDLSGLIFRWRMFDHAAHLSGAVFGLLYALYGQTLLWDNRSVLTKHWHTVSEKYLNKKPEK